MTHHKVQHRGDSKNKGLLDTLTKPANSGNFSLASAGNILFTQQYLNSSKEGVWAVDSRATDYMIQPSTGFISYRPCPSNTKIAHAD